MALTEGWTSVAGPFAPCYPSYTHRTTSTWKDGWRNWFQAHRNTQNHLWRTPAIKPPSATTVGELLGKEHGYDPEHVVGNIVRRCNNQLDLYMRSHMLEIANLEAEIESHPFVRPHSLKACNGKLQNQGKYGDHESPWNLQFLLWTLDTSITAGLTKHKHKEDSDGAQITHVWMTHSSKCSPTELALICDFMLNVCGFHGHFEMTTVQLPPASGLPGASSRRFAAEAAGSLANEAAAAAPTAARFAASSTGRHNIANSGSRLEARRFEEERERQSELETAVTEASSVRVQRAALEAQQDGPDAPIQIKTNEEIQLWNRACEERASNARKHVKRVPPTLVADNSAAVAEAKPQKNVTTFSDGAFIIRPGSTSNVWTTNPHSKNYDMNSAGMRPAPPPPPPHAPPRAPPAPQPLPTTIPLPPPVPDADEVPPMHERVSIADLEAAIQSHPFCQRLPPIVSDSENLPETPSCQRLPRTAESAESLESSMPSLESLESSMPTESCRRPTALQTVVSGIDVSAPLITVESGQPVASHTQAILDDVAQRYCDNMTRGCQLTITPQAARSVQPVCTDLLPGLPVQPVAIAIMHPDCTSLFLNDNNNVDESGQPVAPAVTNALVTNALIERIGDNRTRKRQPTTTPNEAMAASSLEEMDSHLPGNLLENVGPALNQFGTNCDNDAFYKAYFQYWDDIVIDRAKMSAYSADFPYEAADMRPEGKYTSGLRQCLEDCFHHNFSEEEPHSRSFVSRTSRDSVLLRVAMTKMLSDQWPDILARFPEDERTWWGHWQKKLEKCCSRLPDPTFFGFVALSPEYFESRWHSSPAELLKDLFEKHHGEAIMIGEASDAPGGPVTNPGLVGMHHPQFFVRQNIDIIPLGYTEAIEYHSTSHAGSQSAYDTERFLASQRQFENRIFKPVGVNRLQPVNVRYHTLPSLVWNCCIADINLFELYTFFCNQPQLLTKAPHSTKGRGAKQKERLKERRKEKRMAQLAK